MEKDSREDRVEARASAAVAGFSLIGMGLGGAVFLLMLALKLSGVISVSWLWVTFPLWVLPAAGVALAATLSVVALAVALIGRAIQSWRGW